MSEEREEASGPLDIFGQQSAVWEEVVSRFEKACQGGDSPQIEDFLIDRDDSQRPLLKELVGVDLECRLKAGEVARVEEYLRRFPVLAEDDQLVVRLIGDERRLRARCEVNLRDEEYLERFPQYRSQLLLIWGQDSRRGMDYHLLLGLLALQIDFVSREELVAALAALSADKAHPLGLILLQRNVLTSEEYELLSVLVDKHVKRYDGDVKKSLAALSSIDSVSEDLVSLGDSEISQSLQRKSASRDNDPHGLQSMKIPADGRRSNSREGSECIDQPQTHRGDVHSRPHSLTSDETFDLVKFRSTETSPSPPALQVRCPHCQNSVDILDDTAITEITCECCGSSFTLVGDEALAHRTSGGTLRRKRRIGRFELIEQLGSGAFGTVWRAHDTQLDRHVAIKLPRKGSLNEEGTEKFMREARAAAQLRHPNIVGVHEVGIDAGLLYIVSDFVNGVTLTDRLTAQRITPRESAEFCIKIAGALDFAHEHGVIHRDLKPSNIIIDSFGEPHVVDFGLARREAGEVTVTLEGQVLGTPAYMSPEQAKGEGHTADRRSDVYSVGVILFQLLTGELPFRGNMRMLLKQLIEDDPPSPRRLNSQVPRDLETICLKCLEKQQGDRYATAADLASDLQNFQLDEPIGAKPVGLFRAAWRWYTGRRESAIWTAGGFAIILGVVLLLWNLMGFAAVLCLERYRADRVMSLLELTSAIFVLSAPMILLGYLTVRRYKLALAIGTIFLGGWMCVSWLIYLGLISLNVTRSEAFDALSGLQLLLASIATVLYVLAMYTNHTRGS